MLLADIDRLGESQVKNRTQKNIHFFFSQLRRSYKSQQNGLVLQLWGYYSVCLCVHMLSDGRKGPKSVHFTILEFYGVEVGPIVVSVPMVNLCFEERNLL